MTAIKSAAVGVLLTLLILPRAIAQEGKLPIPTGAEQKKVEAEIRLVFKDDFSKGGRDGKRSLGDKLVVQATDPKNTATQRYVCLTLARDAAGAALDLKSAFSTIEKLDELFQMERPVSGGAPWIQNINAQKAAMLETARKNGTGDEDQALIADAFMKIAEGALAALNFEDAATAAEQAVKGTKVVGLVLRAKELVRDIPALKQEQEAMRKAEIALAIDPEDPGANLAQGRFLVFVKKDVDKGLVSLSKCSDADLKDVARKELSKPATAEAAAEVAEGWYILATKAKGLDKRRYYERAMQWFDQALQTAGGISRAKIEKRVSQIEQAVADADPLTKGMPMDGLVGWWRFDDGYGDKVLDSSRTKNHGQKSGGAAWINGKYGGALKLDGTSGNLTVPTSAFKTVTDSFTIALWVKPTGEPAYAIYPVQGQTAWGSIEDAGAGLVVGPAGAKIVEHSGGYVRDGAEYATPVKDWTHFAIVYEKKVPKLYVGGKLVKTGTPSPKTMHPSADSGKAGPFVNAYFAGLLDDLRIYNRSLTEAEIRSLSSGPK